MLHHHQNIQLSRRGVSRRSFLHHVSAGALAAGTLGFRDLMSLQAEELRKQGRSMILLWMQGGPSQLETFDPKPDHENGGSTEAIKTAVSGINIAQGWEQTAQSMEDIAIVRSMTNREGNHQRATYQLHTGYAPSGSVKHPSLGACIAKEIGDPNLDLPSVVSIGRGAQGAGFLGVNYDPFVIPQAGQMPQNLANPVSQSRLQRRSGLLGELENEFAAKGGKNVVENHRRIYSKASKMVFSPDVKTFDLSSEPQKLQNQYGNGSFGKGCLLARRLVETGVTFVEVRHGNWDTHQDVFERTTQLTGQVDGGFGTLVADLKQRGMLDNTLVVWMGEFGRTPRINPRGGRDHYPRVFNMAMAGCGIKGGQVIGSSTADGMAVKDHPVKVGDLFTTICHALKVDPTAENVSPLGRPMRIVDEGEEIKGLL